MVFAFLALIFVSSFENVKRNKSLAILLKNSLNAISLFIIRKISLAAELKLPIIESSEKTPS